MDKEEMKRNQILQQYLNKLKIKAVKNKRKEYKVS